MKPVKAWSPLATNMVLSFRCRQCRIGLDCLNDVALNMPVAPMSGSIGQ